MKQHIPNAITLLNLFCGSCAIMSVLYGQIPVTFALLAVSIFADYLDGAVAGWLNVRSILGKELDSLADMVTFGVLPGVILYYLLMQGEDTTAGDLQLIWRHTPALLITLFSALRLAKFNIDTRQTEYFLGLPTPSSTIFVAGLLAIYHYDSFGLADFIRQPWLLLAIVVFLSWLLVSEIPMFNLKMKNFKWAGNEIRFIFTALAILLLVLLGVAGPTSVILLYILFNIGRHLAGARSSTGDRT